MKISIITVFMGSGEYVSNTDSRQLALDAAAGIKDLPLVVEVYEHAGWYERFYFGYCGSLQYHGIRFSTANEMAKYESQIEDIRTMVREADQIYLNPIRRADLSTPKKKVSQELIF